MGDDDSKDNRALELSLWLTLREKDQTRVEQIRTMLADPSRTRREVMHFCAYHRQIDALNLKPWQSPPCDLDEDDDDGTVINAPNVEGVKLLRRLLAAGLSRYEPDPMAALAEATKRKS